jgi:hypothetical protein
MKKLKIRVEVSPPSRGRVPSPSTEATTLNPSSWELETSNPP